MMVSVVQRIAVRNTAVPQRTQVTSFAASARGSKRRLAHQETSRLNSALAILRRASQSRRRAGGVSLAQRWHLFHRMITGVAAVLYCIVAFYGADEALKVMRTQENPISSFVGYPTTLAGDIIGATTIAASPLMEALHFDTTARRDTLYIDHAINSNKGDPQVVTSFAGCASPSDVDDVYTNTFLRSIYAALVRDAAYNLTFLSMSESELIAPVVDCTSGARVFSDSSVVKVFFLVKNKQPQAHLLGADDVGLLSLTLSNQGYKVPVRDERGSVGVATLALIHSVANAALTHHFALAIGYPYEQLRFEVYEYVNTTIESYWTLRSVPSDRATQVPKTLFTASRTGFYRDKETDQANIKNEYWLLEPDPVATVANMQWVGRAVLNDAWAWAHLVHIVLGLDVIVQVLILLVVVYRNWQKGTIWIGDAFMCISKSLHVRGLAILVSWYLNECWALTEYLYYVGNRISDVEELIVEIGIVQADLMTVYLAVVDLVAKAAQERVDPALTLFLFFGAFWLTPALLALCPPLVDVLVDKTLRDYQMGVVQTEEDLSLITPMRLWNVHPIGPSETAFTLAVMAPLLLSLALILVCILVAKLWRRCSVPLTRQSSACVEPFEHTGRSADLQPEASTGDGSTSNLFNAGPPSAPSTTVPPPAAAARTRFEIATGVELAHQFGLRCNYENVRTIKGLRFISADGVYSNGFVIANGKFLVSTEDVLAILLIKLLRFRYRNVYVYDVEGGHRVQQMARLVYPDTLTLRDLMRLNITTLA